jgi:cytochrome c peroxidase
MIWKNTTFLILNIKCMKFLKQTIALAFLFGFYSCQNNEEEYTELLTVSEQEILSRTLNLPVEAFNYSAVDLPSYFYDNNLRREDNTPGANQISDNGATLGRVLFYDKQLSANNTISCASCHDQSKSFSDPDKLSTGFEGGLTGRNSMSLVNARFYENGRFFWDERAATLEDQVLLPIQDHVEMGLTLTELEDKLNSIPQYDILFRRAFGDSIATSRNVSLSLSQFVRSMVSYQSKFDDGLVQTNDPRPNFSNFTASENRGKQLFFSPQTNCSQCHSTAAFIGDGARNNGLDSELTDLGVGGITNRNNDFGEFKVPSLRNIAFTAPYMHDGRFATLEQVIEHYNSGVRNSPNLDNRLRQDNGARRLNLSSQDKQALKDFLLTLTDNTFLSDEKFSSPFKNN